MSLLPTALTIAGSDPSGGAGVQADLKTFHCHGVYGMAVITMLTAQNTKGVMAVEPLSSDFVIQQLDAVLSDIPPGAIKTGALGGADCVSALATRLGSVSFPLIVDPVMVSTSGASLLDDAGREALLLLIARASLVTPNRPEAEVLVGGAIRSQEDAAEAGRHLIRAGAEAALIKGGHDDGVDSTDYLVDKDGVTELGMKRIDTRHTHGSGCSLAAAITARIASGESIREAVRMAKKWVHEAIATAPGLGEGHGPLNHFAPAIGSPRAVEDDST